MTRKNQKALAEQQAARQAEIDAENKAIEDQEIDVQPVSPLTPEAKATMDRIDEIESAKQVLRNHGLYYSIQSDRTPDREPCLCGCGQFPAGKKSVFCPGHDAKAKAALAGPREPKYCQCGCGNQTKGGSWMPGHDAKYHAAQRKAAKEAAKVIAA